MLANKRFTQLIYFIFGRCSISGNLLVSLLIVNTVDLWSILKKSAPRSTASFPVSYIQTCGILDSFSRSKKVIRGLKMNKKEENLTKGLDSIYWREFVI